MGKSKSFTDGNLNPKKSHGQFYEVGRRLLKNKSAVIGLIIIVILLVTAVLAGFVIDYDTVVRNNIPERLQGPSAEHIFGTDELGRDIFIRIIYATRYSMFIALMANVLGIVVGGMLGILAGYYGKTFDTLIMRFIDMLMAIPGVLLAIAVVSALGTSIRNLIIAQSIGCIPQFARVLRGAVLSIRDVEYLEAAKAIGAKDRSIILGDILPNCVSSIIVNATLSIAATIASVSALSFLGLGVPAPLPEWGAMLSSGRNYIRDSSYMTIFPGLAIMITILAFNLAGDGLRDAFDPKLKYGTKKLRFTPGKAPEDCHSELALDIRDLTVEYRVDSGTVQAVNAIDLKIAPGKTHGLVGETGSGKTTTALSILNLIKTPPGIITDGIVLLNNESVLEKSQKEMQNIRGEKASMIFQDPMTALNPVLTVEKQIAECILLHKKCSKKEALQQAGDMLELVGIARSRGKDYPHQFSGGMKQRVVIAIALSCSPQLLIADEPTTALDVTIQAQVLEIMKSLREKFNTSMLMITHDLGVVAEVCDTVSIIYAGSIVESGTLEDIFENHVHPYTEGLFNSLPNLDDRTAKLRPIKGLMPDPTKLPAGCSFCDRCEYAMDICSREKPHKTVMSDTHQVCCHLVEQRLNVKGVS